MARIRTVKPEFFKHYDLFKAEQETKLPLRLSFSGLWVVADKEGRFKYLPPQLKLDVLPYDDVDFEAVLIALDKYGFIEIYEVEGKKYAHIPTFTEHQRITGTERDTESKIPYKHIGNTLETPKKQKGNKSDDRKGREGKRKGREKEGKGVSQNGSTSFREIPDGVIFDIEKYLIEHEKDFETICMDHRKTREEVLDILKKFHLWNQQKENYPKKPLPLIAGLKTWILNEKKFNNGSHQQGTGNGATKLGTSAARIDTAKKW